LSLLKSYKPGQAKTSRTITNVTGVFLIAWGGLALMQTLPRLPGGAGVTLNKHLNRLMDGSVPFEDGWMVDVVVMNTPVNAAFALSVLITLGALWWWQRFLNTERWAEMLILLYGTPYGNAR
jgi:hypothetical protein